jgi:hypothetical protein
MAWSERRSAKWDSRPIPWGNRDEWADDYVAQRERRLAAEHLARKTPQERAELERAWHSLEDI